MSILTAQIVWDDHSRKVKFGFQPSISELERHRDLIRDVPVVGQCHRVSVVPGLRSGEGSKVDDRDLMLLLTRLGLSLVVHAHRSIKDAPSAGVFRLQLYHAIVLAARGDNSHGRG